MQPENHQATRRDRVRLPGLISEGVGFEALFLINIQIFIVFMRIEKGLNKYTDKPFSLMLALRSLTVHTLES